MPPVATHCSYILPNIKPRAVIPRYFCTSPLRGLPHHKRGPVASHCQLSSSSFKQLRINMNRHDGPFGTRRPAMFRNYHGAGFNSTRPGNMVIWSTIGASVAVFAAWQYAATAPARQDWLWKSSQSETTPRMVRRILQENFLLNSNNLKLKKYWTLFTSAISHYDVSHLLGNMLSLHTFGTMLNSVVRSPVHMATLFAGSALAGSIGYIIQQPDPHRSALGASGVVMGVGTCAAMLLPKARVLLFGIIPCSLWILLPGYIAFDTYYLHNPQSRIGHAAHLGGAAFGALYYALVLRRFGGIFRAM